VDEASVGPADFFAYAAERIGGLPGRQSHRTGGIWPTLQQIATAEAAGLPLLVSGLTDSLLTRAAVCQVALVYGFDGPAALNGSQFIDESAVYPDKSRIEFEGAVHLNNEPGIGVAPDLAGSRRCVLGEAGGGPAAGSQNRCLTGRARRVVYRNVCRKGFLSERMLGCPSLPDPLPWPSRRVVLLAGCGSGATSYTRPAASRPDHGGAPAAGAKVHLVYFNARGAEAAERKLVDRTMKDHRHRTILPRRHWAG